MDKSYARHQDELVVCVKRTTIKSPSKRILLVGHTKLNRRVLREVTHLTVFDLVSVGENANPTKINTIRELGFPGEIAPTEA